MNDTDRRRVDENTYRAHAATRGFVPVAVRCSLCMIEFPKSITECAQHHG